jgi:tetratricopeptide (TPR) repeat protein
MSNSDKSEDTPAGYLTAVMACLLLALPIGRPTEAAEPGKWVARIAALESKVETRRSGSDSWSSSSLHQTLFGSDRVRTGPASRAAIFYSDQTLHRLNQKSEVEVLPPTPEKPGFLRVISGSHYFSSRTPQDYGRIETPTVTAAIRGTEFLLELDDKGTTTITMLEGRVDASNSFGSVSASAGEQVLAAPDRPPEKRIVLRPRDAVRWTLHYPRVLGGDDDRRLQAMGAAGRDLARAAELLSTGQIDEAEPLVASARQAAPGSPLPLALAAIIELAANHKEEAMRLAEEALAADPDSPAAALAVSFAAQAAFDIPRARAMAERAAELHPDSDLALARVSEMRMAEGDLRGARRAAEEAVRLAPRAARALTVLGFVELAQFHTAEAEPVFEKAVAANPAYAMARLGLGIARIRTGRLAEGREEIQTATLLDPDNSLLRSYMAKAYYEERRSDEALKDLAMAKELDPSDPTPYLYEAILKQNENRPVEALAALRESIARNDQRAVYRSRLLLDQDRAVRAGDLARIYNDLGFEQLGLVTARRSADEDQSSYASHLFLSGVYRSLPGFAPAFLSEVLQARIYQPVNVNAVRPDVVNETASFNEYTALFDRPRARAFASFEYGRTDDDFGSLFSSSDRCLSPSGQLLSCSKALAAADSDIFRKQITATLNRDRFAAAVSFEDFDDDGFRVNTDIHRTRLRAFGTLALTPTDTLQVNILDASQESGDLPLRELPVLLTPERLETDLTNVGVSYHRIISPAADLAISAIHNKTVQKGSIEFPGQAPFGSEVTLQGPQLEAQFVLRRGRGSWVLGAGRFDGDRKLETTGSQALGIPPIRLESDDTFTNGYAYFKLRDLGRFSLSVGAAVESAEAPVGLLLPRDSQIGAAEIVFTETRLSPKVGVTFHGGSGTTLRAAAYQRLSPAIGRLQTLEPTQVAGFNQLFDDPGGTRSLSWGFGVDQEFGHGVYGGLSILRRDLTIPEAACNRADPFAGCASQVATGIAERSSDETLRSAYVHGTLGRRISASVEYTMKKQEFDFTQISPVGLFEDFVRTERIRPGVRLFLPNGIFAGATATFYDQRVDQFDNLRSSRRTVVDSKFAVLDARVGYKLPKRYGSILLEALNLSDREFSFYLRATEEMVLPARTLVLKANFTY